MFLTGSFAVLIHAAPPTFPTWCARLDSPITLAIFRLLGSRPCLAVPPPNCRQDMAPAFESKRK